jgi:hypothetical protein
MCFVWILEQTAIISLYIIKWLVFITEMECVYCSVRTGSITIIQVLCEKDERILPEEPSKLYMFPFPLCNNNKFGDSHCTVISSPSSSVSHYLKG